MIAKKQVKNKTNYSINEAVDICVNLMNQGERSAHPTFVKMALIADGFENTKAIKIIEWAQKKIKETVTLKLNNK